MSNETIPLNLFKANLELQLRLQRLVQEDGQQWLENATRAGKDGIAESGAEIENLLGYVDESEIIHRDNLIVIG